MRHPEHWESEVVAAAKRELSYVLSLLMPCGLALLLLITPWVGTSGLTLLVPSGFLLVLLGLPLFVVGFWTSTPEMRARTVPFTILVMTACAIAVAMLS